MDEQRKYAILFAATILAARQLNENRHQAVSSAGVRHRWTVENAKRILQKIDERWPTGSPKAM